MSAGEAGQVPSGGGLGGSDRLARHRRRAELGVGRVAQRGEVRPPRRLEPRREREVAPVRRLDQHLGRQEVRFGVDLRRRPGVASLSEQPQRAPGEVALREFGRAGHEVAAEPDRCERDGEDDRAEFDRDQRADGDCADRGDRDVDDRAGETAVFAGVLWTPKPAERGVGIV